MAISEWLNLLEAPFFTVFALVFALYILRASVQSSSRPRGPSILYGLKNRDDHFTARQSSLDQMHRHLVLGPKAHGVRSCTIVAIPGMGKTLLASEYAHQYEREYDCIFWLNAHTATQLAQEYSGLGRVVFPNTQLDFSDQTQTIEKVRQWFRTAHINSEQNPKGLRWLLIFDNVEDLETLRAFWPPGGEGSIILTTQKPEIADIAKLNMLSIKLEPLTPKEGSDLIWSFLASEDGHETLGWNVATLREEISQGVGGLPLALVYIACYIRSTETSLTTFTRVFEQRGARKIIWGENVASSQYGKALEAIFTLALQELEQKNPDAKRTLDILAFLDPSSVPRSLLFPLLDNDESGDDRELTMMEIERSLRRRQLVQKKQGEGDFFFSIHRSLQIDLLHRLDRDPELRQKRFEKTCDLIKQQLPKSSSLQIPNADDLAAFAHFVPHILRLHTVFYYASPQPIKGTLDFAILLKDIGTYLWDNMLVSEGIASLTTAAEVLESFDQPDVDEMKTDIWVILGILHSYNGISQREKEMALRRRALVFRERLYLGIPVGSLPEEKEIRLYNARADVAFGLLQEEDYVTAQEIMNTCLLQYQKWGTEEDKPFEYSKYYHIMAYVHLSDGYHQKAIQYQQRAMDLLGLATSPASFLRSQYKFMLASFYYFAGNVSEALKLHKEVLQDRLQRWGNSDRRTLHSSYMVAALHQVQGDHELARGMFFDILNEYEKAAWPEEFTARVKFRYSEVVLSQRHTENDKKQAEIYAQQAEQTVQKYLSKVPAWVVARAETDRATIYDHMVPFGSGRTTGKLQSLPTA
ncbi:hypothetical protein BJX63DRAFT_11883 [Aspergillus granulosus]|uniref:NB-ARC domain-containing protein n=1 Tax=Aspergillus granulosus TaxID=176169 RepID=A0ABR4HXX5_9EURO